MKQLYLLLILISLKGLSQSNPFKTLDYDKVVAYEFKGDGEQKIKNCLKNDQSKISKSIILSKAQINRIESAITSKSSFGNRTMSCFDPHFALVYYKNDMIKATVDICLQCNSLQSSIEIPATKLTFTQLTDEYSVPNEGFSKQTRKDIYDFCEHLGFTKYLKPLNSFYDD